MKCQKWFIINKSKIIILSEGFELGWFSLGDARWALECIKNEKYWFCLAKA